MTDCTEGSCCRVVACCSPGEVNMCIDHCPRHASVDALERERDQLKENLGCMAGECEARDQNIATLRAQNAELVAALEAGPCFDPADDMPRCLDVLGLADTEPCLRCAALASVKGADEGKGEG